MSEIEIRDCEHCKNHEYEYSRSKGMWVHGCKKWDCEFEKKETAKDEYICKGKVRNEVV